MTQPTRSNPAQPKSNRPKVCVLGLGQMGLVSAGILALTDPGALDTETGVVARPVRVTMWGHSPVEVERLEVARSSPRLPGFRIADDIAVLDDARLALAGATVIVSAVPVQHIREVWEELRPHVPPGAGVISVAKGVETGTLLRPTEVIADALRDDPDAKPRPIGCLSGPTIATELARCLPAAMIAASDHPGFARQIQGLFNTTWLRVYTNTDLKGVELAGAVKNIIAIAAGIVDGLNAGNNAKSALLARGLAEIARLGVAMGCNPDTFFGVAGVGDLATTCFSPEGRNRSCGEAIGRGTPLKEHLKQTPFVVEGVETTRAVVELADKYRVDMPIVRAVHAVLFESVDPIVAISRLMSREVGAERVG